MVLVNDGASYTHDDERSICIMSLETSNVITLSSFTITNNKVWQREHFNPLTTCRGGYNICVDFQNLLPSGTNLRFTKEAILNIIMVLNQAFLDSEWGQYELDQALMQTLEDASLQLFVVLLQDK